LTLRPGSFKIFRFASSETEDNFLAPPTSDNPPSDLRASIDQEEDRIGALSRPDDPRLAACAVLAKLELTQLEKIQHEEQWKGQTIFKLPVSILQEILSDIETIVAAATDCFAQEHCVLNIPQPCFVFGDIHGLHMRAMRRVRRHRRVAAMSLDFVPQVTSTISKDLKAFSGRWGSRLPPDRFCGWATMSTGALRAWSPYCIFCARKY
jgi:hypothetical protein